MLSRSTTTTRRLAYRIRACGLGARVLEEGAAPAQGPRLLDRVRAALRLRHYSRRTEKAYVGWIRRYILFHGKRHPLEMGAAELTGFSRRSR